MKNTLSLILRLSLIGAVGMAPVGCAATKVSHRPPKKDLYVLEPGTPRGRVVTELGTPSNTTQANGEKVDSFAFDPGVSGGYKFGRAFFHVGADVVTLFLWELIGWPSEIAASNSKKRLDVTYDIDDKVKSVQDWSSSAKSKN